MKKITLSLLLICVFIGPSSAADTVVLNGTPLIQAKGNVELSENVSLSESQQNEYRLIITKNDKNYYWATRENRPLIKKQSGEISIFVEPGGTGYIRVSEQDGRILYLEHMAYGFKTISYWGVANSFSP